MNRLRHIPVTPIDPRRFAWVSAPEDYRALLTLIDRAAQDLRGRVIWNVNSTASGGGVVELLRPLLGCCRGSGVDARWAAISGGPGRTIEASSRALAASVASYTARSPSLTLPPSPSNPCRWLCIRFVKSKNAAIRSRLVV